VSTRFYLGIDLGGTHFRAGLRLAGAERLAAQESGPAYRTVEEGATPPSAVKTPSGPVWAGQNRTSSEESLWDARGFAAAVSGALERLAGQLPAPAALAGIGVGMTGDVNPFTGTCHAMTRFPALEGVALAEHLSAACGAPAFLLNDGLCAALAEWKAGAGRGAANLVMVTLGTGIGSGVVLDGRLFLGAAGHGARVGHQIIQADGPVHCHCELPGCWQSLCAREGVEARVRKHCGDEPIDLADIIARSNEGEAGPRVAMLETGHYLGIGLANLIKAFAPERVLIGGGIAEGNAALLDAAREAVDDYAVIHWQRVPVLPAALGKDAGLLGATLLAEGLP
jgi:glucokinase